MGWPLIADLPFFLTIGFYLTVLKVAAGLGFVIFVHELGHFLVAKFFGVKCEKFYIGFDVPIRLGPIQLPRRLAHWQWGETEYGVGIIPLGGYVKMLGQDDNPANAAREAERIRVAKEGAESESEESFELDPRSYPAKSVPARMAIISAGVIMNLIFAVIFAAIAFRLGVPYQPTEIGSVAAGSPAWVHGLREGDKIIQIGRDGEPSDHLQFDWDLTQLVAQASIGREIQPIDIKVRHADGTEEWLTLTPSKYYVDLELTKFPTIGVSPLLSTTLTEPLAEPGSVAEAIKSKLEPGDRIVGVNGERFDRSLANEQGDLPYWPLERVLARRVDQRVTLTVERTIEERGAKKTRTFEIEVGPNPLRGTGIICSPGPIYSIAKGSPAEHAGIEQGDRLKLIDGQPIGDPLTLQQRLGKRAGETVRVTIERGEKKETIELSLTLSDDRRIEHPSREGEMIAIDALGVAFPIENVVADVIPDSPAAGEQIAPGDELLSATFVIAEQDREMVEQQLGSLKWITRERPLGKIPNWAFLNDFLQHLPPSTRIKLAVRGSGNGGKERTVTLGVQEIEGAYTIDRGLVTSAFQRIQRAESIGDSFALGTRFTMRKLYQVAEMVQKLVTGQWSPKFLGGPVAIATIAGREASQGMTRLLLFLTFLSANLAILNFLPIPALDGGHMVFLLIEGITGKPVNENVQGVLTMIGVLLLLALILMVTFNDIVRTIEAFFS